MSKKTKIISAVFVALFVVILMALPTILHSLGLHPDYTGDKVMLPGKHALIITTSHSILAPVGDTAGTATGVFSSEMTHPYYTFLDGGMDVDIASINGGEIPIDPKSLYYMIKSPEDERFLKDDIFLAKVENSLKIDDVDFTAYDIIFLAGGWGAAYDLGQSEVLGQKISDAYYTDKTVIGGICHGVLGLINAKDHEGNLLIKGRRMTGVTDKQIKELGIEVTPLHPETELRKSGVVFESSTKLRDFLATHVTIDDEKRFVTGQNQNSGLTTAHEMMKLIMSKDKE